MMHLHSIWFAALFPVVAFAVIVALRKRRPAVTVSTAGPFRKATPPMHWWHPLQWPILIAGVGLACLTVAMMRPQKGIERLIERTKGIDIMLVLDVSGSMQAYDVPDSIDSDEAIQRAWNAGRLKSRIDVAKKELRHFVENRPNDRIGLVVFARLPYTVCPPTLDHDYLLNHLQMLDAGMLPDGTGLAAPIASATTRLKDSPAKRRVMVLFTDGVNNVDAEITPRQAAKIAHTYHIVAYTVGVGSRRPIMLMNSFLGRQLQYVRAGLDTALLKSIADTTGGQYFAARDPAGFGRAMHEIDTMEKTTIEAPRYLDYRERFFPWLVLGAALLLLAFLLECTLLLQVP